MIRDLLYFLSLQVCIWTLATISVQAQGLVIPVTLDERIENAQIIVEAEVLDQWSSWDVERSNIYTVNVLAIQQFIKGEAEYDTIQLVTLGGEVGDRKEVCFPALRLQKNKSGLFFLSPFKHQLEYNYSHLPVFSPQYSTMSFINFQLQSGSASDPYFKYQDIDRDIYEPLRKYGHHVVLTKDHTIAPRSPEAVNVTSFSPTFVTAGTATQLTINGSGFGSNQGSGFVEFKDADNGGNSYLKPLASEYVSWSNTSIVVEVPTSAGTGKIWVTNNSGQTDESSAVLDVDYNLININYSGNAYLPNLVDADGSGGYELEFNTDFENNGPAKSAFMRGLNSWRCSNGGGTGVYFEDGSTTSVDDAVSDGINIVTFDSGSALPSYVLGRTTTRFAGCVGGTVWVMDEVDLVFNDSPSTSSYSWNFDEADGTTGNNEFDFESVCLHEIGHAHLLGHVINSSDVMHYNIGSGVEMRDLSSNDLDAGDDIIDQSSGNCTFPAMSPDYFCLSLPLDLLSFEGEMQDEKIIITAELLVEGVGNKVELQKSSLKSGFETYHNFELHNVIEDRIYLSFEDSSLNTHNYYRLKMTDENGHYSYSRILSFYYKPTIISLKVYPNPFMDQLFIESAEEEQVQIRLYDLNGKKVYETFGSGKTKISETILNKLAAGYYQLSVRTNSNNQNFKLIKS